MTTEPQAPAASTYPDDLRDLVEAYLDTLQFSAIPDTAGIEEAIQPTRHDERRRVALRHAVDRPGEARLRHVALAAGLDAGAPAAFGSSTPIP